MLLEKSNILVFKNDSTENEDIKKISEEIKSSWWDSNKTRFIKYH